MLGCGGVEVAVKGTEMSPAGILTFTSLQNRRGEEIEKKLYVLETSRI